jgi:two-component system LytT family response regulator
MTNTFTCIIIDDEAHAIGLLKESLQGLYNNIRIIGTYTTWKDGLEALRDIKTDILFLDISIGGKNGMDILKIIPDMESEVIFITAYSEYALEAFKFSVAGYLVKPVGDAALSNIVDKTLQRIKNKKLAKQYSNAVMPVNSKIGIPNGNGVNYFDVNEIIYFEAVNNYTKVVTKSSELVSSYNIGKYNSIVEGFPFYHVHRSYIVNLNCVTRYEAAGIVIMSNKKEIPVARGSRENFLKLFTGIQSKSD